MDGARAEAILLLRGVLLTVEEAQPVHELAIPVLKTRRPHAGAPPAAAEDALRVRIFELYQKIAAAFPVPHDRIGAELPIQI